MLFGKRKNASAADIVWYSAADRLNGIIDGVRHALDSGRSALVLAHFETTRHAVGRELTSAGIEHQVFDHPLDPESVSHLWDESGACRVVLALTERIARYASGSCGNPVGKPPSIVVAERYPVAERDELVLGLAGDCGFKEDVVFHSSFEDPMFRAFGSDRYVELFKELGHDSTEPIVGSEITRAIRFAQKKVGKISFGDQRVRSPEEWFVYNMPRKGAARSR